MGFCDPIKLQAKLLLVHYPIPHVMLDLSQGDKVHRAKFVSERSSGWNMLYDHFCQPVDSQEILIKEESKKFLKFKNRQILVA